MTLSEKFAAYVIDFTLGPKDEDIMETAKLRVLDYIAVSAAARFYSDLPKKLEKCADTLSGWDPETGSKICPINISGFLNGALAHCLDYDDGHFWAGIHASGPVIGTAFALAPRFRPDGMLFLEAVIAGYEVEYRLGKALGKSHIQKGFHGSSTCGVIGAAVVAGKLIGLDQSQLSCAIGLAGLTASGLRQPLIEGQAAKPLQVGYAAERGITAALLAKENLEAPLEIFEGEKGMFQVMSTIPRQKIAEDCLVGFGRGSQITDTYTKLFPCCRYTHAAIEAAFKLRHCIPDLDEINKIEVHTFDIAVAATAPNADPAGPAEARFSMNYLLAVALHTGEVGLDDFTPEAVKRNDIRVTAEKVETYSASYWNNLYPNIRGAEIIIKTHAGKTHTQRIDKLPGMPADNIEIEGKFLSACREVFSKGRLETIMKTVSQLDKSRDVSELVRLCSGCEEKL